MAVPAQATPGKGISETLPVQGTPAAADSGRVVQPPAHLACPGAATLEALADCIQTQMPGEDFRQFVEPSPAIRAAWRAAVRDMLAGGCDAGAWPDSLTSIYALTSLADSDDGQEYCVLREVGDANRDGKVDQGWGTFIVRRQPKRQLGIQVPHPVDEENTLLQGFRIFEETGAWYLLVAGANRKAAGQASTCQAGFDQADVAHNVDNLFQVAVEEAAGVAAPLAAQLVSLQFHGMARTTCPGVDVLMSYGAGGSSAPKDLLAALQQSLQAGNPQWVVKQSEEAPDCELDGTLNVQGRLLNGVPSGAVCGVTAVRATGRFIHIEQKSAARNAERWIEAVRATFPETTR